MRRKIVAGNWKMNLNYAEAMALADALADGADESGLTEVIVAPPFVYLHDVVSRIQSQPFYSVAAQNCASHDKGAYTGEVAASMLASIGVEFVIIGHSERRVHYHESGETLSFKLHRALEADLIPIYCCGENESERRSGQHFQTVKHQLNAELFHLDEKQVVNTVIAYEPVWAIGTGLTATPTQAQEMHAFIRMEVSNRYSKPVADQISILYGGSVTASNAGELFHCADVDGGLVGGASLKAQDFLSIISSMNTLLNKA